MLKNIKIGKRLIVAFLTVILLFIVSIVLSILNVKDVSKSLDNFYNQPFSVVNITWNMKYLLASTEENMCKAASTENKELTLKYVEKVKSNLIELDKNLSLLEDTFKSNQNLINDFKSAISQSTGYKEQIIKYSSVNNNTEAFRILEENYSPFVEKATITLDAMVTFAQNLAVDYANDGKKVETRSILTLVILGVIVLIVIILLCLYITKSLTKPISEIEAAALQMSKGNLKSSISYISNDELGQLADSIRLTMKNLSIYVLNMDNTLNKLSNKDMTATVDIEYLGDFSPMKISMMKISSSFNDIIYKIREAATQVSAGSEHISDASQALATGATEQSSAVQQLVATVNEVTEHVNINAQNAQNVNILSSNSVIEIEKGNQYMQNLLQAMDKINTQSQRISEIIKVIDSISTQTNLLSLNASIEAARAGEHGTGFAVVANEIGKLANECGKAVKDTTKLIIDSIEAVEEGSKLANETAEVLKTVVSSSSETSELVNKISTACNQQAISLNEILEGIQQISVVVESNSATAEETSASSEQLFSQAETLAAMLADFKLKQ